MKGCVTMLRYSEEKERKKERKGALDHHRHKTS
jgi:hypothetical protein